MINETTIIRIKETADLKDVINDFQTLHPSGNTFYTKCPACDKEGKNKGLIINPSKKIAKCFTCGFGLNSAVTYLMTSQNMSFPEALRHLAHKYNIELDEDRPVATPKKKKKSLKNQKSFAFHQLAESGLTFEDVMAEVLENDEAKTYRKTQVMRSGTRDQYNILAKGDDMIISYYDLAGRQVMYQKSDSAKLEPLYRVRWSNPESHQDKNKKPIKYSSPKGSGSHIYIPEAIRKAYRNRHQISRLYIQEGEKKAEKACKHGILSVGIMGIHNLGKNGGLPYELQLIVKECNVKEVVFVLDADWSEISENIKPSVRVDLRPRTFFYAVKNYRDYFKTFYNQGINIEIYFAYIRTNQNNDKGIDDLLTKTLNQKEDELKKDFDFAVNEKSGLGKYIQLHKITTFTDHQILSLWNLDSPEQFANRHKHILKNYPDFLIGSHKWKFNDGVFESAQPLETYETYWKEEEYEMKNGRTKKVVTFDYENCYNFLQNRGYGRIMMVNGEYQFAHQNGYVVSLVESYQVKDFLMEFTKAVAPKDVRNMLYRGGKMYLGPDSLGNMEFIHPKFEIAGKNHQMLYFKNKAWKITSASITEINLQELPHYVWSDKIIQFDAKVSSEKLLVIDKDEDRFKVSLSDSGMNCDFLMFLMYTSNFYWEKQRSGEALTEEEDQDMVLHFISKMTALGYLLHSFNDQSQTKAVIAMDGKLSEIGASNGRSGKSIFGAAIEQIIPMTYIGAKNKKITEDPFLFEEVTEKTEVVFLDDVRANLDFEFFFPLISGKLTVNPKGGKKFTLSTDQTPKLLISTNHAILGDGASFKDRQAFIAFSDYYNDNHKPVDDFKNSFFSEWGYTQWSLFYNFAAECLQAYLKYGLVKSPEDRLEQRRLRQTMGELFLGWAEDFFSMPDEYDPIKGFPVEVNLGRQLSKKELYDHFLESNPRERAYTPITKFKKKIKAFALYKDYVYNPAQDGHDHKAGGIEFITLDIPKNQS